MLLEGTQLVQKENGTLRAICPRCEEKLKTVDVESSDRFKEQELDVLNNCYRCGCEIHQRIHKTFQIHTNTGMGACPECGESFGAGGFTGNPIDGAINHVLAHGWLLLHVGAEWGEDQDGKSISHTVAILGKT